MQQPDTELDGDTETFETMVAGLVKNIFGPGEKGIKDQLKQSKDLPFDIGNLTYTMVDAAADQAGKAGREFDLDMLMGVSAEVIDSLLQIAEAIGLIEAADDEEMREDCMMNAIQAYLTAGEASPEEQEAAKQMLAQMEDDGTVAASTGTISAIGARHGVDPFADDPVDAPPSAGQPPPEPPRTGLMQE